MSPSNRRQALLPQGARVLKNEVGTAPAFAAEREGVRFYALPGVPREARWLWRKHLQPELSRLSGSRPQAERTFRTVGLAESSLSECLAPIEAEADVEVRYAAEERLGTIRVTLLCREEARAQELWLATQDLIGKYQVALGSDELPEAALGWLHARRLSLATAESCTGGRVAAALTSLAGASAYFKEGMVTYSNQAKTRQLGVPLELLEAHGAVSPEVARAMAQGARAQANADLGLGITGIAGPGGGSPEKPVGLVYLTLAGPGPDDLLELERRYPGTRTLVQTRATAGALGLLVRSLAGGG